MEHHHRLPARRTCRASRPLAIALIATVFLAAACGGGNDDESAEPIADEVPFGSDEDETTADDGATSPESDDDSSSDQNTEPTTNDQETDTTDSQGDSTDGDSSDDDSSDSDSTDDDSSGDDSTDTVDNPTPQEEVRADDDVLKDLISRGLYNHDQILPRCTPSKQRLGSAPNPGAWSAEASPGLGYDVYYLCAQLPDASVAVDGTTVTLRDPSGAQVSQITLETVGLLEAFGVESEFDLPGNVSAGWEVLLGTTTATTGPKYIDHVGVTNLTGGSDVRLVQVLAFLPFGSPAGTWDFSIEPTMVDGSSAPTYRADLVVHNYCQATDPGSNYRGPDPLLPIAAAPESTPLNQLPALAPDRSYTPEVRAGLLSFEDNCRVLPQYSTNDFSRFPVDDGDTERNGLTVDSIGGRCATDPGEVGDWHDSALLHTGIDEGNFDVLATREFYFFGSKLTQLMVVDCPTVPDNLVGLPFADAAAALDGLRDDSSMWTWYAAGTEPPNPELSPNFPYEALTVPEATHCAQDSAVSLIQMVSYQPTDIGGVGALALDWPTQTSEQAPVVRVLC